MDISDPLSPPLSIVHCFRQFLRATSRIGTKLLYVCSSWSTCFCSYMWRNTSPISSSLLLQQCPACLFGLILIVFVMGGRWPYSCCVVEYCLQDLFNIAHCILVYLPTIFFSIRFVSVHVMHPYSSIDTTAAWKKLRFILSVRSDFHMTDSQSITAHAFASRVSMSV